MFKLFGLLATIFMLATLVAGMMKAHVRVHMTLGLITLAFAVLHILMLVMK
jgi:hypothetical protein